MSAAIRQYLVITGNYWAFTLTDGALRMLVVLHFHQLGYSPLEIALLFIFYEFFGVVTNLVGGYLGARMGLNRTMNIGLFLQIVALAMLAVPAAMLTVPWVMAAQALSGIAKDLNKMSAKSGIKLLVPDEQQGTLYKWVAILTGSKNTLKGVGFFLGGVLLMAAGFTGAVILMAVALGLVWLASLFLLGQDLGKSKAKPKFSEILSKSRPSTCCLLRVCSCSVPGMSGSWWRCRSTWPRFSAGTTGRWAVLWPAGLSAMALSRPLHPKSPDTPTVNPVPSFGRQCWR